MAGKFKYEVKARRFGNEVKFIVEVEKEDIKDALAEALKEAYRIFDYGEGQGERPIVSVKRV